MELSNDESRAARSRRRDPAIVLGAAVLAHLVSLKAGWVLDDWELFVQNPYLRSTSGLRVLLTRELFVANPEFQLVPYYRPVSGLMYWLTYQLLGTNPVVQHAFNALLHGGCAVLVFALISKLTSHRRAAVLAGVIVAAHPITAELVAYTGGRQDLLGWALTLGSLVLLLRAERPTRLFAIAFAGTFLAALSREFFLSAPALQIIVAASMSAPGRPRLRSALAAGAGGTAAAIVVLVLRKLLLIASFDLRRSVTVGDALGMFAAVLSRLVKDVFFPSDVVVQLTARPLGAFATAAWIVGSIAAFAIGLRSVRARSPKLVAPFVLGSAALGALAVLHAAVAIRSGLIGDRYAYGALIALLLALTPALDLVARRLHDRHPRFFGAALVAIVLAFVPFTWARAADYTNDDTLQLAMIRERPDDPQALLAEAARLRSEGRKEEAYPLCAEYAAQNPRSLFAHACIAEEAMAKKDYARAAKYLEPWVYWRPGDASARAAYFEALFQTGDLARIDAALRYFEPVEPNAPDVRAARVAYDRAIAGTK